MFGTAQLLPHGVRWDHDGGKIPIHPAGNKQAIRHRPGVLQRALFHIHLDVTTFTERKRTLGPVSREKDPVGIDTPTLGR